MRICGAERGLSEILKRWAALTSPHESEWLRESLRDIASSLGAVRCMVFERGRDGHLDVWCDLSADVKAPPLPGNWPSPDVNTQALAGRLVQLPGVLALPLVASNRTVGVLTLFNGDERRPWTDVHVRRAVALADVLAHALLHLQDRRDVRDTADFSQAVLASVSGDVAVLDSTRRRPGSQPLVDRGDELTESHHPGRTGSFAARCGHAAARESDAARGGDSLGARRVAAPDRRGLQLGGVRRAPLVGGQDSAIEPPGRWRGAHAPGHHGSQARSRPTRSAISTSSPT